MVGCVLSQLKPLGSPFIAVEKVEAEECRAADLSCAVSGGNVCIMWHICSDLKIEPSAYTK